MGYSKYQKTIKDISCFLVKEAPMRKFFPYIALLILIFIIVGDTTADEKSKEAKISNSFGMEFVYIEPGTFMMGSPSSESSQHNDERQHQVTLTKGFYMQTTEVTVGQWRIFVQDSGYKSEAETGGGIYNWNGKEWEKKKGYYWDNPGFSQNDSHPVTCVSWNDANAFIKWINRKEGNIYRLPTEAEWEYSARAGSKAARFWGNDENKACSYANVADRTAKREWSGWIIHNCDDGYVYTSPVGSFKSNSFGLYDILGNAWEWCQDWYGDYPSSAVTNPTGPSSGLFRVDRGGCWGDAPMDCRSARRDMSNPDYRVFGMGFRLVRDLYLFTV